METGAETEAFVKGGVTKGFAKVVQKIHTIDFEVEYDALVHHMEPDPARTEFGHAYAYADGAESRARRALQLVAVARVEQKAFEFQKSQTEAQWRRDAMAVLQAEKDAGTRSKQIAEADIRAIMIELNGQKLADLEERSQKIANAVDVLSDLAKLASLRCKTAQMMLSTVRK